MNVLNPFKKRAKTPAWHTLTRHYQFKLTTDKWDQRIIHANNAFAALIFAADNANSWTQMPFETVYVHETKEILTIYTRYSKGNGIPRCYWDKPAEAFVSYDKPKKSKTTVTKEQ